MILLNAVKKFLATAKEQRAKVQLPVPSQNVIIFLVFGGFLICLFLTGAKDHSDKTGKSSSIIFVINDTFVLHNTSEEFLSLAIDSSFLRSEINEFSRWKWNKLQSLSKPFAPAYLRVGGNDADRIIFKYNSTEVYENPSNQSDDRELVEVCSYEEINCSNGSQNDVFELSGSSLFKLNRFCQKSNLKLVFDLNVLLRDGKDWNSSNAQELIEFSAQKMYNIDWQLGNEPNSFLHVFNTTVSGEQLGKDFIKLRHILDSYPIYTNSKLIGPDITRPKLKQIDSLTYMDEFLEEAESVIDVISWHQYYLNGRTASLNDFINPDTFDLLPQQIDSIMETVRTKFQCEKPVWISETSSAYGGGAPGLSDAFVATFLWIDKLGISARRGIDVVVRQNLMGASYSLLDKNLNPLPDWWISFFYKKLVGPEVLNITMVNSNRKTVRLYAHCSKVDENNQEKTSITVFGINVSNNTEFVHFSSPSIKGSIHVSSYILTAPFDDIHSRHVLLNGKVLPVSRILKGDFRVQSLVKPKKMKEWLFMPQFSVCFWVISGLQNSTSVC